MSDPIKPFCPEPKVRLLRQLTVLNGDSKNCGLKESWYFQLSRRLRKNISKLNVYPNGVFYHCHNLSFLCDENSRGSPLHKLALFGLNDSLHADLMREIYLLRPKIQINAQDRAGNTALQLASYAGNEYVLIELLKMGAKVDTQDNTGITPILECCARDLPIDEDGHYVWRPKRHLVEKRGRMLDLLRNPPRTYLKRAEKNLLSLLLNKLCEEPNKKIALGDKKDIDEMLNDIGYRYIS